eukprot:scaffold10555_cov90-Skeletonema_marinoi.AAC.1
MRRHCKGEVEGIFQGIRKNIAADGSSGREANSKSTPEEGQFERLAMTPSGWGHLVTTGAALHALFASPQIRITSLNGLTPNLDFTHRNRSIVSHHTCP